MSHFTRMSFPKTHTKTNVTTFGVKKMSPTMDIIICLWPRTLLACGGFGVKIEVPSNQCLWQLNVLGGQARLLGRLRQRIPIVGINPHNVNHWIITDCHHTPGSAANNKQQNILLTHVWQMLSTYDSQLHRRQDVQEVPSRGETSHDFTIERNENHGSSQTNLQITHLQDFLLNNIVLSFGEQVASC